MDESVPDMPLLQQILETVTLIDDRLTDLENKYDETIPEISEGFTLTAKGLERALNQIDNLERFVYDADLVKTEELNTALLSILLKALNISREELLEEITSRAIKY